MKKMRTFGKSAFTLVELLVVIGIIALLAAILLPAIRAAFLKADKNRAEIETKAIKNAVQAYINDYGKLPVKRDDHGIADKFYYDRNDNDDINDDSQRIISILTANDTDMTPRVNPRNIAYLEAQTNSITGGYTDPWDTQYGIVLDNNYDNKTTYDDGINGSKQYGTVCIAISAGPDKEFKTTDDITSSK